MTKKKPVESIIQLENNALSNAQDTSGRVKLLLAVGYKDGMVYARRVDKDLFFWDAVWGGKLFSSHMIITSKPGEDISKAVIHEITDILFAGACATIDFQRGDGVTKEEQKIVDIMESKRKQIEGEINGS